MALSSQIRKLQVRLENIGKCINSWGGIYKYITLIAIATQQTFFFMANLKVTNMKSIAVKVYNQMCLYTRCKENLFLRCKYK